MSARAPISYEWRDFTAHSLYALSVQAVGNKPPLAWNKIRPSARAFWLDRAAKLHKEWAAKQMRTTDYPKLVLAGGFDRPLMPQSWRPKRVRVAKAR